MMESIDSGHRRLLDAIRLDLEFENIEFITDEEIKQIETAAKLHPLTENEELEFYKEVARIRAAFESDRVRNGEK